MKPFSITFRNLRCFEDRAPVTVEIRLGFTALVGPNNSGKSSFLRAFHELRPLFQVLRTESGIAEVISTKGTDMWFMGVNNTSELEYDRNDRPISLTLEFANPLETEPRSLVLTLDQEKRRWFGEILLGARRIQLREMNWNNDWIYVTAAGTRHDIDLTSVTEAGDVLESMMYVGPYRNAINAGSGSYYDLSVGTQFIADWDEWKTGKNRAAAAAMQNVIDDIIRIFGYRRVDISAAGGRTEMQIAVDGKPYRLHELGAGIAQFIIVLASVAMKRPSFLLIDEPELHLHPTLQIDFLTTAASYAKQGVIFASHSIGLARATADRVYSFQKTGYHTVVSRFEQTSNYTEFVGELSYSSFRELGHEWILLVEGTTEVKALQQFLRALGKDHRIVIVPLGGEALIRGGVEQELAELQRLSQRIAVLIDSERSSPTAEIPPNRQRFLADCKALGFLVHATERRAFENYLTAEAILRVKGEKYRALEPFELLENAKMPWGKNENWRIAREMTSGEIVATDIGRFLEQLG